MNLVKDFDNIEKAINEKFRNVMPSIQVGENLLLGLDYNGFETVLLKVIDKTWIASCFNSDVRFMIECDVIELY